MFKKTVLKRLLRKTAPLNPVVSRLLVQLEDEQKEEVNNSFSGIEIKDAENIIEPEKEVRSQSEILGQMGFEENK